MKMILLGHIVEIRIRSMPVITRCRRRRVSTLNTYTYVVGTRKINTYSARLSPAQWSHNRGSSRPKGRIGTERYEAWSNSRIYERGAAPIRRSFRNWSVCHHNIAVNVIHSMALFLFQNVRHSGQNLSASPKSGFVD